MNSLKVQLALKKIALFLLGSLCFPSFLAAAGVDEDEVELVFEEVVEEAAAESSESAKGAPAEGEKKAEKAENKEGAKGVTPPSHLGPAMPNEETAAITNLERAREYFNLKEWAKGLDLIHTLLEGNQPPGALDAKGKKARRPAGSNPVAKGVAAIGKLLRNAMPVLPAAAAGPGAPRGSPSENPAAAAQKVITLDGIHYQSLDGALRRQLFDLPPEARQVYLATYEPPARAALDEALKLPFEASLGPLREVARRYPLTAAAFEALKAQGDRALDLGLAAQAADAYKAAIESQEWPAGPGAGEDRPPPKSPALMSLFIKLAFAGLLAGRTAPAQAVLARIARDYPAESISIGGASFKAGQLSDHPVLKRLLDAAQAASSALVWSGFTARPDHACFSLPEGKKPPLGSRAQWIYRFSTGREDEEKDASGAALKPRTPLRESNPFLAYPAFAAASQAGRLFVRHEGDLLALDAATGKILWKVEPPSLSASYGERENTYAPRDSAAQNLGENDLCLAGGLVILLNRQSPLFYDQQGNLVFTPNQLLAYDQWSGKLRWRLGGPEEPKEKFRSLTFTAPPTPAGGDLLVAPATQNDAPFVLGLTAAGKVRWTERLYGYNAGYLQQHRNAVSQGATLAVSGGLAVAAPGHGVVTALEAESGRIRWITRYRTISSSYPMAFPWAPAQPVISGKHVIAAPYDSTYLIVLDLETGKTLWERSMTGGVHQLLGADAERIYVAGSRVEALELKTGAVRYTSGLFKRTAGRGFVTADEIYLPQENGLAIFRSATGEPVANLGWADDRMKGLKPGNLGLTVLPRLGDGENRPPAATQEPPHSLELRLVAAGAWGIALVRPQEESWAELAARADPKSFERAGLLRADGRFPEAMDLLESILAAARTEKTRERAKMLLLETAQEAASKTRSPRFIERLLRPERREALELEAEERLPLELERARLLEESAPQEAAALYLSLLKDQAAGENSSLVLSPDGILVSPSTYCRDSLRELVFSGKAGEPQEGKDSFLRALNSLPPEPAKAQKALAGLLARQPYFAESAEALAHLARLAGGRGDAAAAAAHLERLLGDFPKLQEAGDLGDRIEKLQARLRLSEADSHRLADGLARPQLKWMQRWWKGNNEGFLVESAPGSEPARSLFALKGGKLRIFDLKGNPAGEVELPEFPDIEQAKAELQSHIEEPAVLLKRGPIAVLLTAAGIFNLEMPAEEPAPSHDPEAPKNPKAAAPKPPAPPCLKWHRSWPHAIAELQKYKPQWGWGWNVLSRVPGNLFPEFLLLPGGREQAVIVQPEAEILAVHLATGKVLSRSRDKINAPVGEPVFLGDRLSIAAAAPPGLKVVPLDRNSEGGFEAAASKNSQLYRAQAVPEIAAVLDTSRGIEVHDASTRKLLWREEASRRAPSLVLAAGSEVWIANPLGALESRSLQSGRLRWSAPIPANAMPIRTIAGQTGEHKEAAAAERWSERPLWILLATDGQSPYIRNYGPFTQSGKDLVLLLVTRSGQKLKEISIASGGMTFDGRRRTFADPSGAERWLLAYNQAGKEGRWFSRAAVFDPASGKLQILFENGIAGKGTGMPSRLALLDEGPDKEGAGQPLALALGNAEGFGLYALASEEEAKQSKEKAAETKNSGGPENKQSESKREELKKSQQ